MPKVFTYGTLQRGQRLHCNMEYFGAKFISEYVIHGYEKIQPDNLLYPFIIKNDNEFVNGELFEIEDKFIPILDEIEGVPRLFTRTEEDGILFYEAGPLLLERYGYG